MSEKYIRVKDIPKVCPTHRDLDVWGVKQYTIDDLRGHGHWVWHGEFAEKWSHGNTCSVCGEYNEECGNYCSYCGTTMDEVEEDD